MINNWFCSRISVSILDIPLKPRNRNFGALTIQLHPHPWMDLFTMLSTPTVILTSSKLTLSAASIGPHVMRCFNSTSLPAISTLALDFAVFDQWHSSIPGPTFPNRLFFLSGTSQGSFPTFNLNSTFNLLSTWIFNLNSRNCIQHCRWRNCGIWSKNNFWRHLRFWIKF